MDTTITLPAGGKLHASRSHLCLAFEKTRFSLSTAIYGGGFKEINYAVNQKLETFYPSEIDFPEGLSLNFYVFTFWKTDMIRQRPAPFLQRHRWNGVP